MFSGIWLLLIRVFEVCPLECSLISPQELQQTLFLLLLIPQIIFPAYDELLLHLQNEDSLPRNHASDGDIEYS